MIYFIYPNVDIWEYMVEGITDNNVVCRALNPNCNILQMICRKTFTNSRLPGLLLFGSKMRKELKSLKAGDTVLIPDYIDVCLFRTINSIVRPDVRKCLWIWNPVKVKDREMMHGVYKTISDAGFEISTFDKDDSNRYNQQCYNQFFRMKQNLNLGTNKYDFYFIGFEKNRAHIISELKRRLENYNCFFKVVHSVSECLPYSANMQNIATSKCIIEIVQDGQKGSTLRPLEALSLKKKLLTNNKNVKDYDFYSPQNIFILGEDNIDDIDTFINSEFEELPDEIIKKYDIATWLNHYINIK
jgi:hypothetical protein